MLDIWFQPVENENHYAPYQLGSNILVNRGRIPDLSGVKIAIIGVGKNNMEAIRAQLFAMRYPYHPSEIIDLGNLRKEEIAFFIPVLKELQEVNILPIIICGDPKFQLAQYKAFQGKQQAVSLALVDDKIRLDPQGDISAENGLYLNEALFNKNSRLFHLTCLGYQNQYLDPKILEFLEDHYFDFLRLGLAKGNLSDIEPLIRDADIMAFSMTALKYLEAPGMVEISPSGFFSEEACQITRYAGLSDKMKSFGIYGFDLSKDESEITAQTIAQMIWYFLEGYSTRFQDFPVSTEGLLEYIVEMKHLDYQLTFWKSGKSGRWWLQVPVKTKKQLARHRLIPCSYEDYQMSCRNELPERLLNALRRFD
jgi:formiminoglutamase